MKKKKKYTLRKLINDVHLWLGLGSGIILFLVCLSGTILAFEHEIKAAFAQNLVVEPSGEKLNIEELKTTLAKTHKGILTSITIPEKSNKPYTFTIKENPRERRGTNLQVNPYTAETLVPEANPADAFCFFFFKMHRWLLLDSAIGRPIVGVATILFLILSITGLVLWFPKKVKWKNLKSGFKIKTKANWKRVNHDLHNTLGFYALIFIVIMGITGLCWSFESYKNGLSDLIGAAIFNRSSPKFDYEENPNDVTASLAEVITTVNATLEYPGELSVNLPGERSTYYSIRKYNASNFSPVTYDAVYISKAGAVLGVEKFSDKPFNVQVASLIRPIHTGEVYGFFSKLIYFIACLIATSLPVTGTLIWLNKMKKKKK
ncbi:PepSY-associated TM helix domain-containing protein [Leeuwenhoekiella sp. W20_SRS_FM14]|uniref:PepSY-associated TM helix domain-containing protein n=1 Tax=Leeuwenhoekiella sp. W20_SRS_FM14 TaxID=3240270 RepID=UPI003F968F87